jgi:hypothetical protein
LLSGTPTPHVIDRAFNVTLGVPAGDMRKRGFRENEFGAGNSWVRTDDAFFDRVTVDVSIALGLVESITASKVYTSGDRNQRQAACEADLESISATVLFKYPALHKAVWLKSEDGMGGLLGYYRKRVFEEPTSREVDPSPARVVSLTCIGPSALPKDGEDPHTVLFVSYRISELERVPINRAFNAEKQRRERARSRALGVNPDNL